MRESSIKAHDSIKAHKSTHYNIIKKAMFNINKPSTGKYIASKCNLTYHAVMRRLGEMRNLGVIEEKGNSDEKYNPILWDLVKQ